MCMGYSKLEITIHREHTSYISYYYLNAAEWLACPNIQCIINVSIHCKWYKSQHHLDIGIYVNTLSSHTSKWEKQGSEVTSLPLDIVLSCSQPRALLHIQTHAISFLPTLKPHTTQAHVLLQAQYTHKNKTPG